MATNNTYVSISFELLENILSAGFSITTARLLIGMIYAQDRADLWRSDDRDIYQKYQTPTLRRAPEWIRA